MVSGWVTLGSQVHPGRVRGTYLYLMGPGLPPTGCQILAGEVLFWAVKPDGRAGTSEKRTQSGFVEDLARPGR